MFSQNSAVVIATTAGEANYSSPDLVTNVIPGTNGIKYLGGLLRGDADVVLRYVGAYWHRFVEPIRDQADGQWGYSLRPIRGQVAGFSNHSSGTASDTNSALHPIGSNTLTRDQTATLGKLLIRLRGIVRFGAFYTGRVDEMHSEVVIFDERLRRLADDIRAGRMETNFPELVTNPDPTPQPTMPAAPADWWDTVDEAQARRVVSEEVGKVIQSDGVTGAGDLGRLSAYLEPQVRRWVNEEITKVSESQGFAGAADTGRFVSAIRDAGYLNPAVTDDQILEALRVALA